MVWYVGYFISCVVDFIVSFGLSDWYDIGFGDLGFLKLILKGVIGIVFYYQDSFIFVKVVKLLGCNEDIVKFEEQVE